MEGQGDDGQAAVSNLSGDVHGGSAPSGFVRLSKAEKKALKVQYRKQKRADWRQREREMHRQKVVQRRTAREQKLVAMSAEERAAFEAAEKVERDRLYAEKCEQTLRIETAFKSGLRVAIDLSYGERMNTKERNSLSRQLARCWGANRRAAAPVSLHFAGMATCGSECLPPGEVHRSWKVAAASRCLPRLWLQSYRP
jgi:hypothetical protein